MAFDKHERCGGRSDGREQETRMIRINLVNGGHVDTNLHTVAAEVASFGRVTT